MTTTTRRTGWAAEARAEAVARQARPRPAIVRDRWHRYTYRGVTYPGLTSVLGVMDKGPGLLRWACRLTAEAAVEQADQLPGLVAANGARGVVDMLLNRADMRRDAAADRGSAIHGLAERLVRGEPMPDMGDDERAMLGHVREWWEGSGWRLRLAEALVVSPSLGYGGTLDLMAYDAEGRTVVADYKTGASVYGEVRLQLLGYAEADLVAPQGGPVAYPMPRVDRLVVLHVTPSGVVPVDVEPDDLDREALRGCLPVHRWRQERKGKVA